MGYSEERTEREGRSLTAVQPVLWPVSLSTSLILSLSFHYPLSFLASFPPSIPSPHTSPAPPPPDEVYAQKMKYKAISEELDNALNDITSL